jgi:hypothetical protein
MSCARLCGKGVKRRSKYIIVENLFLLQISGQPSGSCVEARNSQMRDFAFRLGGSMRSYLSRVACVAAGAEGLCFMAYHTTVFPVSYSHRPCTYLDSAFFYEGKK